MICAGFPAFFGLGLFQLSCFHCRGFAGALGFEVQCRVQLGVKGLMVRFRNEDFVYDSSVPW